MTKINSHQNVILTEALNKLWQTAVQLEQSTNIPQELDAVEGRRFLMRMLSASVDSSTPLPFVTPELSTLCRNIMPSCRRANTSVNWTSPIRTLKMCLSNSSQHTYEGNKNPMQANYIHTVIAQLSTYLRSCDQVASPALSWLKQRNTWTP